jgi:2-polyprenyl-3-methyl-5-hydroxy-6-metoxy-1,4-benzoquinol methylase
MLSLIDNAIQRRCGLPYLYVTRDHNIHSRCRYLVHKLRQLPGSGLRLLDVGCGSGLAIRHLAHALPGKVADYVGIDLDARRLVPRYRDIRSMGLTFLNIELDDDWCLGGFDVIWCSEVIEHLENDQGLMQKLGAALKPDGVLLLTTPSVHFVQHVGRSYSPILQLSPCQDGGHVRHGYAPVDLVRLAERAGLHLVAIDGVNRLSVAETRERYDSSGLRRMLFNLRQYLRWRRNADFLLGEAFLGHHACCHSIAAEYRQASLQAGRQELDRQACAADLAPAVS